MMHDEIDVYQIENLIISFDHGLLVVFWSNSHWWAKMNLVCNSYTIGLLLRFCDNMTNDV